MATKENKMKNMMLSFLWFFIASNPAAAAQTISHGRYQIFFSPHMRADTFLLDTETGKIWKFLKYTDIEDEPSVWLYMDRIDNITQLIQFASRHKIKKQTQPEVNIDHLPPP